jgi:hypothetical protein
MVIMAFDGLNVSFSDEDAARIPDLLVRGALTLVHLARGGELSQVAEHVRIRRSGGFCGLDVWLVLWLYFASGSKTGLKRFWSVAGPHAKALAALAGRTKLTSPSSMSRALSAVELDLLRPAGDALLLAPADCDQVLRHPAVQTYDTLGEGWHCFDFDPTVTALRHRALPTSDDLPAARRLSEHTGAPGYKGRKRGDIVFRRAAVQHSGSGLWVHAHLSGGNGDKSVDFGLALDSIVATAARLGHPLERVLVRMDGEHGNVPWFAACRERGVPFVTRLNRTKLFDDPEVLARLRSATFHRVEDSGCGPQRAAADLGMLTLQASANTRRPDGSKYDPVEVRVVACVFPKSGKAKRGRTIDGWEVELFAVDLPADRWPAPEAITAYYGRNAQENRFAQDDRELGLDRIASYHLPGQELATLVGLSVWNHDVVRGFEQSPPPMATPVQHLRQPVVDERVPAQWPRDPVVTKLLGQLAWGLLLTGSRAGWSFCHATGEVVCSDGRALTLTTVRKTPSSSGQVGLIFRRPKGGCEDCTDRPSCLRTDRVDASKHAEFSVDATIAEALRVRLARTRRKVDEPRTPVGELDARPGPRAVRDALFLPAKARRLHRDLFLGATLRVEVHAPPTVPVLELLADDTADRQRRRKTWAQNVARHALCEQARVTVQVACRSDLRAWLGGASSRNAAVGGPT